MKRSIGVVTGTRAEYGYLRPLIRAIEDDADLELRLYVTGMHLLKEYGHSIMEIEKDGFDIAETIDMGSKAMSDEHDLAVSIGTGVVQFAGLFTRNHPEIVIVFGDRTEPFAAAIAASAMNIPVAHIAGGDVGFGDIDHLMRHAITKLAHLHFTQTESSKERVLRLGEEDWRVFNVGALTLDTILGTRLPSKEEIHEKYNIPPNPFILISYHPTTTEWKDASKQMELVLNSVAEVVRKHSMGVAIIYPNDYPGGTRIVNGIKRFKTDKARVHVFENLPHLDYMALMMASSVLVGNSSSGIIEAPSLGVAYVCVGTRQKNRERAQNVIDVDYDEMEITAAIERAISDENFQKQVAARVTPYGDGTASHQIIEVLKYIGIDKKLLQKKMTY